MLPLCLHKLTKQELFLTMEALSEHSLTILYMKRSHKSIKSHNATKFENFGFSKFLFIEHANNFTDSLTLLISLSTTCILLSFAYSQEGMHVMASGWRRSQPNHVGKKNVMNPKAETTSTCTVGITSTASFSFSFVTIE